MLVLVLINAYYLSGTKSWSWDTCNTGSRLTLSHLPRVTPFVCSILFPYPSKSPLYSSPTFKEIIKATNNKTCITEQTREIKQHSKSCDAKLIFVKPKA